MGLSFRQCYDIISCSTCKVIRHFNFLERIEINDVFDFIGDILLYLKLAKRYVMSEGGDFYISFSKSLQSSIGMVTQ